MVETPRPGFWNGLMKRMTFADGGISDAVEVPNNPSPVGQEQRSIKIVTTKQDLIGSTGTAVYRGYLQEDYLAEMRGRRRADKLDQMRRSDAVIKMCLSSVINLIKSANWEFQPSADMVDKEAAQKHADFMSFIMFEDLDRSWEKKLSEILTLLVHGHSVFEKTHKIVPNHPRWGSYIGLKSLGFRSQRTIERWNVDDVGDLVSVTQYAYGDFQKLVDIPAKYLVLFNVDQEGSNFEGISPLRVCYGPWKRKDLALKLNIIGIEKYAVPTPIGTVPTGQEGLDRFDKFKEILEAYTTHESNYMTVSEGWKIEMHSNVYDPQKVIQAIQFENSEMACAFLAQFLLLGTGSSNGSYALSNDQSDFMMSGLDSYCKEIEGPINQNIVKELIDLNFGPQTGYPQLKHSDVSDKAGKELSEVLKYLIDSRVITPDNPLEEQMRKRYHLPVMDEATQRQVQSLGVQPLLGSPGSVSMAEKIRAAIKRGINEHSI